jgi:limonene-1,2-epoxide hydrolase
MKGERMKRFLFFSLSFLFVLAACSQQPSAAPTATKDAISIVEEFYAAMNAHDLPRVMSYLADNAILTADNSGKTVQGAEEIWALLKPELATRNYQWENSDFSEKAGEVQYTQKVTDGPFVVFMISDGLTIVKDGKIIFNGMVSNKPK